jgi:hypothetical protein
MSPFLRGLLAAVITLVLGSAFSLIAVRQRWVARVNWLAAFLAPLAVGLFIWWSATRAA